MASGSGGMRGPLRDDQVVALALAFALAIEEFGLNSMANAARPVDWGYVRHDLWRRKTAIIEERLCLICRMSKVP